MTCFFFPSKTERCVTKKCRSCLSFPKAVLSSSDPRKSGAFSSPSPIPSRGKIHCTMGLAQFTNRMTTRGKRRRRQRRMRRAFRRGSSRAEIFFWAHFFVGCKGGFVKKKTFSCFRPKTEKVYCKHVVRLEEQIITFQTIIHFGSCQGNQSAANTLLQKKKASREISALFCMSSRGPNNPNPPPNLPSYFGRNFIQSHRGRRELEQCKQPGILGRACPLLNPAMRMKNPMPFDHRGQVCAATAGRGKYLSVCTPGKTF